MIILTTIFTYILNKIHLQKYIPHSYIYIKISKNCNYNFPPIKIVFDYLYLENAFLMVTKIVKVYTLKMSAGHRSFNLLFVHSNFKFNIKKI